MKRCPECSFLYLDSDEVCDLDGTRLVHASDADVEAASPPPNPSVATEARSVSNARNHPILIAGGGLVLGLLVLLSLGYVAVSRRNPSPPQVQQPIAEAIATPQALPSTPSTSPPPLSSATPDVSPSTTGRPAASPSPRVIRATVSNNPVSTGASQTNSQGHVVIRLSDGSRIEADEVWRTKEGVWYRRSGMVTLLKAARVKSIEKSARK